MDGQAQNSSAQQQQQPQRRVTLQPEQISALMQQYQQETQAAMRAGVQTPEGQQHLTVAQRIKQVLQRYQGQMQQRQRQAQQAAQQGQQPGAQSQATPPQPQMQRVQSQPINANSPSMTSSSVSQNTASNQTQRQALLQQQQQQLRQRQLQQQQQFQQMTPQQQRAFLTQQLEQVRKYLREVHGQLENLAKAAREQPNMDESVRTRLRQQEQVLRARRDQARTRELQIVQQLQSFATRQQQQQQQQPQQPQQPVQQSPTLQKPPAVSDSSQQQFAGFTTGQQQFGAMQSGSTLLVPQNANAQNVQTPQSVNGLSRPSSSIAKAAPQPSETVLQSQQNQRPVARSIATSSPGTVPSPATGSAGDTSTVPQSQVAASVQNSQQNANRAQVATTTGPSAKPNPPAPGSNVTQAMHTSGGAILPSIPISQQLTVKSPSPTLFKDNRPTLTGGHALAAPTLESPALVKIPQFDINGERVLSKRKLSELVAAVVGDTRDTMIDGDVEELLLDLADEFVTSVTSFACRLAKHRKADILEARDLQMHLERNWNIRVPGFSSDEVRSIRKITPTQSYIQKVAGVNMSRSVGSREL